MGNTPPATAHNLTSRNTHKINLSRKLGLVPSAICSLPTSIWVVAARRQEGKETETVIPRCLALVPIGSSITERPDLRVILFSPIERSTHP